MTSQTLTIHVGPQKLTDGSFVYNVHLGEETGSPVLPAASERDAIELAETIAHAIQHHSLTDVRLKVWEAA